MSARFTVRYRIAATDAAEAQARARDIALEQTVEIPADIVPAGFVAETILGRVEAVVPDADGFLVDISYADAGVGSDVLQLLNVVFGNSSLKPGIRVAGLAPSDGVLALCPGPRFGAMGLRQRLGVPTGPLLLSAIKPVGLDTAALADLAHRFALGGMDMVKDDHGLTDQRSAPFAARLRACVDAVGDANARTGGRCIFVPNVTGPDPLERAFAAQEAGAGAVMLAPALTGYGVLHRLATHADFHLPILSHPAFGGANVVAPGAGFDHGVWFGTLPRLLGVDAVIYPNFGGRFGFTVEECRSIAAACAAPLGTVRSSLPTPGGGMTLARVPEMQAAYGDDVIYLMGGALLRQPDLAEACRELARAVGRAS